MSAQNEGPKPNNSGIVLKNGQESDGSLPALTRQAREHFVPENVDWERVEARLFARVEEEAANEKTRRRLGGSKARSGTWLAAVTTGGALALAAAAALVMGRPHVEPAEAPRTVVERPVASVLTALEGGEVLVDGRATQLGGVVTTGSTLLARGGAATFERKGEVMWTLERGASATVTRAHPLVLALIEGAIEAQVEPVANGEAFAIDVGPTRVAVHGTHLRVARDGEDVSVDLSEGVVSIGSPPASGSTLGELVTAPAHIEFSVPDTRGTFRVNHAAAAVRTPVVLARPATPAGHGSTTPAANTTLAAAASAAPRQEPATPQESAAPHTTAVSAAAPAVPDPHAETTIANAVRTCLADRPQAEGVSITVESTLELKLSDDGTVQIARFNPALPAEVQGCATSVIYKTRFTRTGTVSIPIAFKR